MSYAIIQEKINNNKDDNGNLPDLTNNQLKPNINIKWNETKKRWMDCFS